MHNKLTNEYVTRGGTRDPWHSENWRLRHNCDCHFCCMCLQYLDGANDSQLWATATCALARGHWISAGGLLSGAKRMAEVEAQPGQHGLRGCSRHDSILDTWDRVSLTFSLQKIMSLFILCRFSTLKLPHFPLFASLKWPTSYKQIVTIVQFGSTVTILP